MTVLSISTTKLPYHQKLRPIPHRQFIRCSTTINTTTTVKFDLRNYWTTLIDELNCKLDELIPVSYPQGIYEAMRYSVLSKGAKRAPPVMCIAACEFFGGNRLAAFPTACALEMVHSACLIHGDLPCMENDQEQRGHPANHVVHGENIALLSGDALFPLAFRHIATHTSPELVPEAQILQVITEIAQCVGSTGISAGQFVDMEDGSESNSVAFIEDQKFGKLTECSAVCGGLLAGASEPDIEHLRRYGRAVGVLYHLTDAVLLKKAEVDKREDGKRQKGKSNVSLYGVEKAMEIAQDLRAQAKKELDEFQKFGEKVIPLYSFVDYAADREFSIGT